MTQGHGIVGAAVGLLLTVGPAVGEAAPSTPPHVRVHAHMVLLDRTAATRVGLGYVQVGAGLVALDGSRGRRAAGVGVAGAAGGMPVSAFVDLARSQGVLRSESRVQVLTLAGSQAAVSSGTVGRSRGGVARVQGPELVVTPTVLEDGRVQLEVRARLRDEVSSPWFQVDGSPVDVWTTVVVRPGEAATVGTVRVEGERTDAGLLHWSRSSEELDVLVVLRPELE
jgi:hypothetical protein